MNPCFSLLDFLTDLPSEHQGTEKLVPKQKILN